MSEQLNEKDIKAGLIDYLLSKGFLHGNSVLINEMVVDNFRRRIDLAVANGKLHAYEIKSDKDSLYRLNGQVETYSKFFDKVTIVCSKKFVEKAKHSLPKSIEIIEVSKKNSFLNFKLVRRGKTETIKDRGRYLSYVEKKYILKFLRDNDITCSIGMSRQSLYELAYDLPISKVRDFAIEHIKEKYRKKYDSFLKTRGDVTTSKDIDAFKANFETSKSIKENVFPSFFESKDTDYLHKIESGKKQTKMIEISENMAREGLVAYRQIFVAARKR